MPPGGSQASFDCRRPVEASSRWRNARSVEARRDFRAHEFEKDPNASSDVKMHKATKGFSKWSRQDANRLADLEITIQANESGSLSCDH